MIYLDNSATTRVLDEAAAAASACMTQDFFNPASAYAPAVAAERRVNEARARLAQLFGASADEIVYTSGGTESNNAALFGSLKLVRGKRRIVTDLTEHPSVYEAFRLFEGAPGTETVFLPARADGTVSPDALEQALTPDTAFVSIMHVNNETGAVNDIASMRQRITRRAPGAVFHVDGVQAFGKLPFSRPPCDLYSISGHKLHAPKGIGALYVRHGARFAGSLVGGGQERELRAGTTNTPGIAGLDAALAFYRAGQAGFIASMRACKLRLANLLLGIPDTFINGPAPEDGAPHILNVSFIGVRGEVLLNALSDRGVYVSTGSACAARKKGRNRVLGAMGLTDARQEGAIRFSLSPFTTQQEIDCAAQLIAGQVAFLRRYKRR